MTTTTRRIVPREATEKMLMDGAWKHRDFMSKNGPYPRTKAVYAAMLDASPASGKVTEGEVEKAARAAFNSLPWEEYSNFDRRNYIHMIKRALAALDLEVE